MVISISHIGSTFYSLLYNLSLFYSWIIVHFQLPKSLAKSAQVPWAYFWLILPSICSQAMVLSLALSLSCILIIIVVFICVQQFWLHNGREQLHMWHVYWHTSSINVYQVIRTSPIFMAFEEDICCWYIFWSSMVKKFTIYWFLMDVCSNRRSI